MEAAIAFAQLFFLCTGTVAFALYAISMVKKDK